VTQNGGLELAQARLRVQTEFLDEQRPPVAVGLQRVGLTARPVQRQHQLRARALT
jgi:hypothetical protein